MSAGVRQHACSRCGTVRETTDLAGAYGDDGTERWFCHPFTAEGRTCYIEASYDGSLFGSGAIEGDDGE